jgi:hypothetical protein
MKKRKKRMEECVDSLTYAYIRGKRELDVDAVEEKSSKERSFSL